jgi:hypothetical protein
LKKNEPDVDVCEMVKVHVTVKSLVHVHVVDEDEFVFKLVIVQSAPHHIVERIDHAPANVHVADTMNVVQ